MKSDGTSLVPEFTDEFFKASLGGLGSFRAPQFKVAFYPKPDQPQNAEILL